MTFFMQWGLALVLGLLGAQVQAQGFSALVTPPRVETAIKPGQTTRQVLEITQVGPMPGRFRVYSNDWSINASGGVDFFDEIQSGSCRPWVALERREMTVAGIRWLPAGRLRHHRRSPSTEVAQNLPDLLQQLNAMSAAFCCAHERSQQDKRVVIHPISGNVDVCPKCRRDAVG